MTSHPICPKCGSHDLGQLAIMPELMKCRRCGSLNDVGVCWKYDGNDDAPDEMHHDMQAYIVESTTMSLEDVLALNHQEDDE